MRFPYIEIAGSESEAASRLLSIAAASAILSLAFFFAAPSPASLAGEPLRGDLLFARHCALCHGTEADGRGEVARFLDPPPRDFTRDEIRIRSGPLAARDDLVATLTRGIPGTAMPSFGHLPAPEREAIADFLLARKKGRPEASPPVPPMPALDASLDVETAGRALYEKAKCALCHGAAGLGDGAITRSLVEYWDSPFRARDLTRGDLFEAGNSPEDVFRTLTTGFPGTPMASYADSLADAERALLARYVSRMSGDVVPRSAPVDSGVSAKRGQWVFLGKGRCVGCHRAEGLFDAVRGPDLTALPSEAATRREGLSAAEYVVESILDPRAFVVPGQPDDVMPLVNRETLFLEPDDVSSLAAFLLGTTDPAAIAEIEAATKKRFAPSAAPLPDEGLAGDARAGRDLYFDAAIGCASCHLILGHGGGDVGPDLTHVGALQSRRQLRASIESPSAAVLSEYARVGIETNDGDVFVGFPLPECGGESRLRDGLRARAFAKDEIAAIHTGLDSSMPANLGEILGDSRERAVSDLVAFLENPRGVLEPAPEGPVAMLTAPLDRKKPGPPLGGVVRKTSPAFLRAWLTNPLEWDERATMPAPCATAEEVEDIVAFLAATDGPEIPAVEWPTWATRDEDSLSDDEMAEADAARARGRAVFQAARCRLCHSLGGTGGETRLGPSLDGLATKTHRDWIDRWIEDPKALHPDTAMPRYRLSKAERRDLVLYLTTEFDFVRDGFETPGPGARTDAESIRRGRDAIVTQRCTACHAIPGVDAGGESAARVAAESGAGKPPPVALIDDARCLSCHAIGGRGGTYAPDLWNAGRRLKPAWVESFLAAPDVVRLLSQQMPRLGLDAREATMASRFIDQHLVAGDMGALATLGDPARGREIYAQKACRACHQIGAEGGAMGPELTRAGERLEPEAIVDLLLDPKRYADGAPKPHLALTQREAENVAAYIATLARGASGAAPAEGRR